MPTRQAMIPKNLMSLYPAAALVSMKPARLLEFAKLGLAPHWLIDGEPFFVQTKLRRWVAASIAVEVEGQPVSIGVAVNVTRAIPEDYAPPKPWDVPSELRHINPLLPVDSLHEMRGSGVYFLCEDDAVTYVGQSVEVTGRVPQHAGVKDWNCAWYIPIPLADLDRVESAFIYTLKPKHNRNKLGHLVSPLGKWEGRMATAEEFGLVRNEWSRIYKDGTDA